MSFYIKPKDVTYTQMCIWIDNNAYADNCDEELMFEYLYHISRMLAYKKHYFEKASYYDDFALSMASKVFMRYKNPKQFEEGKKIKKIKSVLNYSKSILYACKVAFENDEYAQNYIKPEMVDSLYDANYGNILIDTTDNLKTVDFNLYLSSITSTIKEFVKKLPHRNEVELMNIYTSCSLSLLSSVVLTRKNQEKMENLIKTNRLNHDRVDKMYKTERENCIILYHLPTCMKPYITVLVNEIRRIIAENLTIILNEPIYSESNIKSMMLSSLYSGLEETYEDDE